ncbi:MAG: hypothetical protein JJU21_07650 [Salinarimonas sp.]|nr:hypothetical protein [Salinarimonas sp.]
MVDIGDRIAQIENEIFDLADRAENCRKVMIAARIGMIGGGVALAAFIFGILRFDGLVFVVAVTAILVGIVTYGSNKSTREQLLAQITQLKATRTAMIDSVRMETVTPVQPRPGLPNGHDPSGGHA